MTNNVIDLEVIENINILLFKKVIIYGTSKKAEELWEIIYRSNLSVIAVCDSFKKNIGKKFKTFTIQSFEVCCKNCNIEDVCIIICSSYVESIMEHCKNISKKLLTFITPFGFQWSYFLNRNNQILSCEFRKWYNEQWEQWSYIKTNEHINYMRQKYFTDLGDFFFKTPILIYQVGKVGSRTVYDSLSNLGNDVLHIHNFQPWFNCFKLDESKDIKEKLKKKIQEKEKIKIISLIRDPIERDISFIFQCMFDPNRWMYKNFSNDLQGSIIKYMDTVLCGTKDIMKLDDNLYKNNEEAKSGTLGFMLNWFAIELESIFGINVYEYDFDKKAGYTVIRKDNIECLIIKLEKLNQCLEYIKSFLDLEENIELYKSNVAEEKKYKYIYKKIKKQLKIPNDLIERYYNKKQLKHFYTNEEINYFKNKWKKFE